MARQNAQADLRAEDSFVEAIPGARERMEKRKETSRQLCMLIMNASNSLAPVISENEGSPGYMQELATLIEKNELVKMLGAFDEDQREVVLVAIDGFRTQVADFAEKTEAMLKPFPAPAQDSEE